jgi:hypothetical protein
MKLKILLLIFSIFAVIMSTGAAEVKNNVSINISSAIYGEAGMSAYTKADTTIDLNNVRSMFRIIEIETSDYIIGSVPATSLPETEDVHAYVDKTGWILIYYPKNAPASKMVQWANYNGGPITTTILADMVSAMASAAGVSYSGIKYYNFKYPGANKMMLISDWSPSGEAQDSYQFKIPSSFVVNENSHSLRCRGGCWANMDGARISSWYGTYSTSNFDVNFAYYSSILSPDVFHQVDYDIAYEGGHITVLIYKEP